LLEDFAHSQNSFIAVHLLIISANVFSLDIVHRGKLQNWMLNTMLCWHVTLNSYPTN